MDSQLMRKLQSGLLGSPDGHGLLSPDQLQSAQSAGLLDFGSSLLANSGPSRMPTGLGQLIGQASMAGRQGQQNAIQNALNNALLKKQLSPKPVGYETLAPGATLYDPASKSVVYTAPAAPKVSTPLDPLGQLEDDFRNGRISDRKDYEARKRLLLTRQPTVSVSMNSGNKLGETMASEVGKQYAAQYDAAQSATEAIASSQRVRDILKLNPYTGAGADFKLSFGKAAKAAGFDYGGDDIQNTELLAKELGQNVLNNVKSSGLAGSQGLTEGERKFLLQVVGGTIELDSNSLSKIADLNERVGRNSIKRWNATVGRLPVETLNQLGMGPIEAASDGGGLGNGWSIVPSGAN